jgi:hypothetical protein
MYADLAKALTASGDLAGARTAFQKSLPVAEEISSKALSNARVRSRLAQRHADVAEFHRLVGDASPACEHFARSASICTELRRAQALFPADASKAEEAEREATACTANVSAVTR